MKLTEHGMSIEGQIVNLNKLAFEKDSQHKLKILERAYQMTLSNQVSVSLQVFTVVNLSSLYVKELMEFRALCLLAETLNVLGKNDGYYWERVLLIVNLAKIKASINSVKEALKDLMMCLEYLGFVHFRNSNYYTVLATVHYNLSTELRIRKKFSQSIKHAMLARAITAEHLGVDSKIGRLLNASMKYTDCSYDLSPYSVFSKSSSPENVRSKSRLKPALNLKFFKKFEKVSQSSELEQTTNKKSSKLGNISLVKTPLEALKEEEEFYCTSYPKLTLDSTKSKQTAENFRKSLVIRDPDPEPSVVNQVRKGLKKKVRTKKSQIEVTRDIVSKVVKIQRFIRKFLRKRKNLAL